MLMTGKQKDRQTDNQTDRLVNSPGTSKEALSETCVVGYGGRVQTYLPLYMGKIVLDRQIRIFPTTVTKFRNGWQVCTDRLVNSPGTSEEALSERRVVGYGVRVHTYTQTYIHTYIQINKLTRD